MQSTLLFIVGLTGVGKSTTLSALTKNPDYYLLPNRRTLADDIIIPFVQQTQNTPPHAVTDRIERFRLTAAYRQQHPDGMVHALQTYLTQHPPVHAQLIFDNIRGLAECQAAVRVFPAARYIFLDAPPFIRLQRLVGRNDAFDTTRTTVQNSTLKTQLQALPELESVFSLEALLSFQAATQVDAAQLLGAVKIILKEQQNYQSQDALAFLRSHVPAEQLLYVDTGALDIAGVRAVIEEFLA